MATFLLTLAIILLSVAGLALGVMRGRAPLKGSCGGTGCEACDSCPRRLRTEP
ncbi:hypothetical protein ACW9UR_04705 [Halovulum sp. GXIMD14794]